MQHCRVYLQAELGKLRNLDDAQSFLTDMPGQFLREAGFADKREVLSAQFADQGRVDDFVQRLSDAELVELTRHCDEAWRTNGVSRKLSPQQRTEFVDAPIFFSGTENCTRWMIRRVLAFLSASRFWLQCSYCRGPISRLQVEEGRNAAGGKR